MSENSRWSQHDHLAHEAQYINPFRDNPKSKRRDWQIPIAAASMEERTVLKWVVPFRYDTCSIICHFHLIHTNLAVTCVCLLFISRSFSFQKAIASVLCDAGSQRPSPLPNNIEITQEKTQIEAITWQETGGHFFPVVERSVNKEKTVIITCNLTVWKDKTLFLRAKNNGS